MEEKAQNHSEQKKGADFSTLASVAYQDRLILTTEQLAEFYGCEPRRITENFKRNQERFIEGKHYFKLEGAALKEFKDKYANCVSVDSQSVSVGLRAASLILWTKQGAARHAKMLNTDRAWEVYELLEESYFEREEKKATAIPPTDTLSLERKVEVLLECAKLTNLDRLRNQFLRKAALLSIGEKF